MYVTLEPCDHTGRTGPCTDVIIAARPARVVVGCRDPNPLVDGRGLARLRRAGIRVDVGCLEDEAKAAIRAYSVWVREKRPLVTLKAAATLDGFIAPKAKTARAPRAPIWITSPEARAAAHELRAAHDAILVGAGTVRADNPRLTVRDSRRRPVRQPLRVVLAGRQPLPPRCAGLRPGRGDADDRRSARPGGAGARAQAAGGPRRPVGAGRGGRGDRRRLHQGRAGRSDRAVRRAEAPGRRGGRLGRGRSAGRPRAASRPDFGPAVGPDLLLTADVDRAITPAIDRARML